VSARPYLNLLTNAVKFVPRDPRPKCDCGRGNRPYGRRFLEPEIRAAQVGPHLGLRRQRTRISAQDRNESLGCFERVYSPQEFEGTGIGLAIVQKAVERMGGRVGVESSPGQRQQILD